MRLTVLVCFLAIGLPLDFATAEDLPLVGMAHVGVRVSDLEKSRAFYQGALGYEEAFDVKTPDGAIAAAFFKVNDQQFIEVWLGLKADDVVPMTHIGIETNDIEKLHRMLEARRVKVGPVGKDSQGNLNCAISELPGQNLKSLEFIQYLPDSLQIKSRGKALGVRRISTHLEHAGIIATDYQAARQFYVEKLGFRETWTRKQPSGQPLLNHLLMPGAASDFVELSSKPKPLARSAAGMAAHFALTVPDARAMYQEALSRGLQVRTEPKFGMDERWQFNLFDPDGTRAECMQPPAESEPAAASRAGQSKP
jgi:catechol 2,3-dioxygenase-like lactoylglutathione lyase family enzyme